MRRSSLSAAIAVVLAILAGGCNTVPPVPEVVEVVVKEYVAVPAALTADCDRPAKKEDTYGEAIRLANARDAALEECSGRIRKIRRLGRE